MIVKLNVQQDSVNTLKEKFEIHSNKELKKVYILCGNMKESGFDILEEFLIDLKARKYFIIGIDKKNTTRRMIEELCKYTKNVYLHNNNYEEELDANVFVFEYSNKAFVYISDGSMSESSLVTNVSCYTEIEFDLDNIGDKEGYKDYVDKMVKISKSDKFNVIDKLGVSKLVEEKEIFSTKQYTHNVMSISELLSKKETIKNESEHEYTEEPNVKVPKVDLNKMEDFAVDIDLGEVDEQEVINENNQNKVEDPEIKFDELKEHEISQDIVEQTIKEISETENEEYTVSDDVIDMESMLFQKADIKLKPKVKKAEKDIIDETKSRKVDLEKVSNLFLELPKRSTTEKDVNSIKIPNYIKDMISNFFAKLGDEKIEQLSDGNGQRKLRIDLELVEINSNTRYKDSKSSIIEKLGKTYISIETEKLRDIYYEEGDMARIIKLSDDMYHIEIIPKTCEEYSVWKKLCTTPMRGTNRCYGVM